MRTTSRILWDAKSHLPSRLGAAQIAEAVYVSVESATRHNNHSAHLFGTAFQHLLIVLTIGPFQVGAQALRRLIGQLDAVLQQADGQSPLQQWRRLC